MKGKFSQIEVFYYLVGAYSLWSSQDLFLATVQFQGTQGVSVLDPSLILVGAFIPVITITSSCPVSGAIVGIFILLSPVLGAISYHDYKKKRLGILCFILTMMVTSNVVTGTYFSPTAGVGGLFAPIVTVAMFLLAVLTVVKYEIKKELKTVLSKDER